MPLILTHGWPGSVFELIDTIGPLTDPRAHGWKAGELPPGDALASPATAFPASSPASAGTRPDGTAWEALMQGLGYDRYVAQGGDVGCPRHGL